MSNYTKATNFASKDTLPTGNPLKTLSGTEIDDEFSNIQTAITSKANTSSPTLTGTPLAPTAATSNSSTQIATTAFTQAAITAVTNLKAPLASPALTGVPTAPTAASGTNTTQVATTEFTTTAINGIPDSGIGSVVVDGAAGAIGRTIYIDTDAPASEGNNGDIWFEY